MTIVTLIESDVFKNLNARRTLLLHLKCEWSEWDEEDGAGEIVKTGNEEQRFGD